MKFPSQAEVEQIKIEPVQSILKAKATKHAGALHGIVNSGGRVSIDGFIIEVVADNSQFRTIQIYECAKDIRPKVQQIMRTKTKIVSNKGQKKLPPKQDTLTVDTSVKEEDLF